MKNIYNQKERERESRYKFNVIWQFAYVYKEAVVLFS